EQAAARERLRLAATEEEERSRAHGMRQARGGADGRGGGGSLGCTEQNLEFVEKHVECLTAEQERRLRLPAERQREPLEQEERTEERKALAAKQAEEVAAEHENIERYAARQVEEARALEMELLEKHLALQRRTEEEAAIRHELMEAREQERRADAEARASADRQEEEVAARRAAIRRVEAVYAGELADLRQRVHETSVEGERLRLSERRVEELHISERLADAEAQRRGAHEARAAADQREREAEEMLHRIRTGAQFPQMQPRISDEVRRELAARGLANPMVVDDDGWTCLHHAIQETSRRAPIRVA
ncbi:MAG: hypothetical protein GY772_31800, partial [bacterium]|nr:hypothetical protein [bacterium]